MSITFGEYDGDATLLAGNTDPLCLQKEEIENCYTA